MGPMEEGCTGMIALHRGDIIRETVWGSLANGLPPYSADVLHPGWCGIVVDFIPCNSNDSVWYNTVKILVSGTGAVHPILLTDSEITTYIEVVG